MSKEKEFIEKISEILEVEPESLTPKTDFRNDIPFWDSLKGFGIIVLIEEDYGKKLTVEEFLEQKTIGDLYKKAIT
ncbi:acyl carrier protein [uncultured Mesotoga sp.]|uniref:acyl carrier protein n=1 Tax=uncultured Mesotoga sp. TaxID=1184400 RepID=UPI00259A0074|nr:acyl carrier protein [uncultured Mesotoga sp.]